MIAKRRRQKLNKNYAQSNFFRELTNELGTIVIHTTTRKSVSVADLDQQDEEGPLQIFSGTLKLPYNGSIKTHVSVSFLQEIYAGRSLTIGPIISVSNIVREDAEVFAVIRRGDLLKLMQMLDAREIALTTRDRSGRCLLNVGLFSFQTNK